MTMHDAGDDWHRRGRHSDTISDCVGWLGAGGPPASYLNLGTEFMALLSFDFPGFLVH